MQKSKWTPGPWKFFETSDGECRVNEEKGGYLLARCYTMEPFCAEQKANARLIALVPDFASDKIKDFTGIGKWLSAALDDPNVCEEMKKDIRDWFDRFSTFERATGMKIEEVIK